MKKLFKSGIAILTMSLFITSCSNDDKPTPKPTPAPSETIDNNKFQGEFKNKNIVLDAKLEYKLTGKVVIDEGSTLTIPAGTKIVGIGGTKSYIVIAQGGKIDVQGTADKPVVMTGAVKERGAWGGLVLCGKAPINKGATATAEVSDLTYGGTDANDNSGSIKYLRVEYAGAAYNSEKEFNGISFFGVGNGTVVEYVQTHEGADDGFEFFGGTVNTKYLVSTHNDDDQFDWTEGWSGTNEYWYSKQSGEHDRGIEADNNSNDRSAKPIANPVINNVTLIGTGNKQGMKLREGTQGKIDNVVLANWKTGIDVEHDETIKNAAYASLRVTNVKFIDVSKKVSGKNSAKEEVDVDAVFTENDAATGAGNGVDVPDWAKGWTVGL